MRNFRDSFNSLKLFCESNDYKGWDPYDGLNSKVFQALPLKYWDLARLVWIQGFKRSPINFRKLLLVPKEHNAKGVALFLSGYCKLYHAAKYGGDIFGSQTELLRKIKNLTELLLNLSNNAYSGACWGYNFDWQARQLFLFEKNTPTIVVTAFCVEALIESYNVTKDESVLKVALSAANFVLKDLTKTPYGEGHIFSYSVKDGNNTVINASLLGAKILSYAYKYNRNLEYYEEARKAVNAACDLQEDDGSWVYGLLPVQIWKDSFHTGFNLDAIATYQNNTKDQSFRNNIQLGWKYYIKNFFESDGKPKYYHNKTYPIDIHCPAQVLVTASKLDEFEANQDFLKLILDWTIKNMQSKKGYFYYQYRRGFSSKISYMRWSNAFMFNAMAHFHLESVK